MAASTETCIVESFPPPPLDTRKDALAFLEVELPGWLLLIVGWSGRGAARPYTGLFLCELAGVAERAARLVRTGQAAEVALRMSGPDPRERNALLRWLFICTENLIEFRWADVEAVARALLDRKILKGKEIQDIIRSAEESRYGQRKNGPAKEGRSK